MKDEKIDYGPNVLCEGCYTYHPEFKLENARIRCDYVENNSNDYVCPCTTCVIKMICKYTCPEWLKWRDFQRLHGAP